MAKHYSPERQAEVLALLKVNRGSVALTSLQTSVPERTIRDWRRKNWLSRHQPLGSSSSEAALPPQPPPAAAADSTPHFDGDAAALKFVRSQIITELVSMAASLKDTLDVAAPYHRILALTQLLDRLAKLDAFIPRHEHEQRLVIEYKYPDGTIHPNPPWAADDDEEWKPW